MFQRPRSLTFLESHRSGILIVESSRQKETGFSTNFIIFEPSRWPRDKISKETANSYASRRRRGANHNSGGEMVSRLGGGKGPAMQFILIHALKKIHVICVERRMYGRTNPIV